jgi:hypothetical protein
MLEDSVETKRPISISIISVLGMMGSLYSLANTVALPALGASPWALILPAIASAVSGCCMVGLWFMKRWAALTYFIVAIFTLSFLLVSGLWTAKGLVFPAIAPFFVIMNIEKMK